MQNADGKNMIATTYVKQGAFCTKTCFFIMPFGKKAIPDAMTFDDNSSNGKDGTGVPREIDFDKIYDDLIYPVIHSDLGLSCDRSDKISKTGLIHKEMIERIIDADVVIVDITTNNANVFYELGVRHSVHRCGTILIRKAGWHIPFNINGLKAVDYDLSDPTSLAESKNALADYIQASLTS